jgi:hypothetical protein
MESKEHLPWIAAMLATSVAFATRRHRSKVADEASLRRMERWQRSWPRGSARSPWA